jgi:ATP-binding cassette, subfamily B, multidrug efflux pump
LPLGVILFAMIYFAGPIHHETVRAQERLAEMTNDAQEQFAGMRVVRAFGAEQQAIERFDSSSARFRDQSIVAAKYRGLNWVIMVGAKDLGMVVLIAAGAVQLIRGAITLGEFFVFNLYLGMLFWPMVALGWIVAMYQRARASMERLEALLASPPAITPHANEYAPAHVIGKIEFRDFRFAYPKTGENDATREVLRGVDLVIKPGTILGITGGTGSGKSTLLAAIARLVDLKPGSLFIDDVDITEWNHARLRRSIGFVSQDSFLFADTLRSNLALAKDEATDQQLLLALERAQFDLDPKVFPKGLDTMLGERGVTLSGGQRQRVTIARALLHDPQLILLDDCLSAVDADTEARVLAELRNALRGRTAILVSHRVAALEIADRIVVLDDGVIVADGTPAELRRRDGRYRDLCDRQQCEAELELL